MTDTLQAHDKTIYQEMMSHPVVFAHGQPKNVAIIGDDDYSILPEILKHRTVTHVFHLIQHPAKANIQDNRVDFLVGDSDKWMASAAKDSLDILIIAQDKTPASFETCFNLLHNEGILLQQSQSLFDIQTHKLLQTNIKNVGFTDIHFLSFPQPHFSSGWRTVLLAKKSGNIKRAREKDIFNKSFSTHYYNFDIHKASLVLPEFMRQALEVEHD
jgi:spermidine synthase